MIDITEGRTRLLIPEESIYNQTRKAPIFFNPKVRISRDMAILAYRAYNKKASIIDALAGIGVRGIRAKRETNNINSVYINDINPNAIRLAKEIAMVNNIEAIFSINEANKFLLSIDRAEIIEIDPFGTPAYYVDNALRAIKDNGMICLTATDTPVLQGLYPKVAERRYYGRSARVEYSIEIGLRLILGMLARVAGRLELAIEPLFAHSIRNHMRVYAKVKASKSLANYMIDNLNSFYHCFQCNNRGYERICIKCKKDMSLIGPLWVSNIFNREFVNNMLNNYDDTLASICKKILLIAIEELDIISYYTIDEMSRRLKIAPPSINNIIDVLNRHGFKARRSYLEFNGFKTNANYDEILSLLR
jgi:tRNA (guanine26-N2/guanine27-N2)-dimethyltransferase